METAELKKLWNTMADHKLIGSDIAQKNILAIITKKGNGVLAKMKRKANYDFTVHAIAAMIVISAMLFLRYWNGMHPEMHSMAQRVRSYFILGLIELLMIVGILDAIRNKKFLNMTFNTMSVKGSMTKVRDYLKAYIKRSKIGGLIAMYIILGSILIDFFLKIGGIGNLNFTTGGAHRIESYLIIFVMVLMVALPYIAELGLRRFKESIEEIEQTLKELD